MKDCKEALFRCPEEREMSLSGTLIRIVHVRRRRLLTVHVHVTVRVVVPCAPASESAPEHTVILVRFSCSCLSMLGISRRWLAFQPSSTLLRPTHATNRRHLSNLAQHPSIQNFASSLAQTQPYFSLSSEKIHILSNPAEFYTKLIVRH
jgi:hypothetical protein